MFGTYTFLKLSFFFNKFIKREKYMNINEHKRTKGKIGKKCII